MESRFQGVWSDIRERRAEGEPFDQVLEATPTAALVAALAAAGADDPVAANAIATHLLNRIRRAPFLVVFLVSLSTLVAIYISDVTIYGPPIYRLHGAVARVMAIYSALLLAVSGLSFALWKGRLPRVRAALYRRRHF